METAFGVSLLFWIFSLLVLWLWHWRKAERERSLFAFRLHRATGESLLTLLRGVAVGLVLSLFLILAGVRLPPSFYLLALALAWLLGSLRLSYWHAGKCALLLGLIAIFAASGIPLAWLGDLSLWNLLFFAALLFLGEYGMLSWKGSGEASPWIAMGKRGRLIGAYRLQSTWVLPVFCPIPGAVMWEWVPWLPMAGNGEGWSWLLLPLVLGHSLSALDEPLEVVVRRQRLKLLRDSLICFAFAAGGYLLPTWEEPLFVTALVATALSQVFPRLFWRGREGKPVYASDQRGMKVLAIVPGSPAEQAGVKVGEVVAKVNGKAIREAQGYYEALQRNAAFCKLEVLDAAGEVRFLQLPLYANQPYQLGILAVPDKSSRIFAPLKAEGWLQMILPFRRKWADSDVI